ncbi:MAG: hypothetical protein HY094_05960 [Candidatus Melainabacteria bacterium]|nr:hypothetical protein [Candidatus Melainabacteria bacterium]
MVVGKVISYLFGSSSQATLANRKFDEPLSTLNKNLYRAPLIDTPINLVPTNREGIKLLSHLTSDSIKDLKSKAKSPTEYISNIRDQLSEIRKLTFNNDIGVMCRRFIDLRAYMGIKVWNELANSKSKLYLSNTFKLGDIHIIYLLDKLNEIDKIDLIPAGSGLLFILQADQNKKNDDLIKKANRELYGAFTRALNFLEVQSLSPLVYPGNVRPGLVIVGKSDDRFYMNANSFLGIELNYEVVEDLIHALSQNSYKDLARIRMILETRLVHEIVHQLQGDIKDLKEEDSVNQAEIAPFAVQFIHNSLRQEEGELDENFILPFDFSFNNSKYEKSVIAALKVLYKELCSVKKWGFVIKTKPKNFKPTELKKAMNVSLGRYFYRDVEEIIHNIKQKIIDSSFQELLESANKIPDLQQRLIEKFSFEGQEIEIICDELMVSPAIVTLTKDSTSGNVIRNIRINSDIAEALTNEQDPNNASAKEVLESALTTAKRKFISPYNERGEKLDSFEYAAKRIEDKLDTQLGSPQKKDDISLKELRSSIDALIKEGKFQEIYFLARDKENISILDDTLLCWDYRSDTPIQRTYVT